MNQHGCIRILIVDDHAAIRRGLRHLLAACAGMVVVGEADDADSALAAANILAPNVVLLDVRLPDASGFEIAVRIREAAPLARIIMLASLEDEAQLASVMCPSIDGYVQKREADEKLAEAIQAVMGGARWPTERVLRAM